MKDDRNVVDARNIAEKGPRTVGLVSFGVDVILECLAFARSLSVDSITLSREIR